MLKDLQTIMSGEPKLYHTTFTPHPPSAALSDTTSPVTELLQINFPSDLSSADKDKFEQDIKKLISIIEQHSEGANTGSAGGWIIENDQKTMYMACIGWQSVAAHVKFRDNSHFKDNVHLLRDAKGMESRSVAHASLTEVQAGPAASAGRDVKQDVQEEVLNPMAGGEKEPPKTKADGSTTKNVEGSGSTQSFKKEKRRPD